MDCDELTEALLRGEGAGDRRGALGCRMSEQIVSEIHNHCSLLTAGICMLRGRHIRPIENVSVNLAKADSDSVRGSKKRDQAIKMGRQGWEGWRTSRGRMVAERVDGTNFKSLAIHQATNWKGASSFQ